MRRPKSTLRNVAIFKGVTHANRLKIERLCAWRTYQRGSAIIHPRDGTCDVFFLIAGRARVIMYSLAGKPVSFREIGPGEMVGEFAAIDGGPRSTGVEVLETSRVAIMSGADFNAMLSSEPLVMKALVLHLVAQIRGLTARIFEISTQAVDNRIHAEILRLAKSGVVFGRKARICPFPKHREIASRISTRREAVTRRLNDLERQKLIERIGATLVIHDLPELEQMVKEATGN